MAIKRYTADKHFSDAIRLKQNHTCEHCGIQGRMECAHIYGRANKAVRWCVMNAVCLCHTCHRRFTENPLDFHAWLKSHYGEASMETLNEKRRAIFKTNKQSRQLVADHYREQVKLLQQDPSHEIESYQ